MEIYKKFELEDCPFCGGAGLLEEENDWCWYVTCVDCGSQTAPIEYRRAEDREGAAGKAANLWNLGKVIRSDLGE
ncbi:MAG: Lar family restriction alleviation protein [Mogibacterium sp.]|nr:Lar family restriction alleviation protein [Mogibacterium sp.]MBR2540251.1 Lar family restriction alleviation protein [Mogibacterium sp.]